MKRKLVLASASPRRRELLEGLGVEFTIRPCDIDEYRLSGEKGEDYALRTAARKAEAVELGADDSDSLVLAADTVVCIDDEILGKPEDKADAERMLRLLSGREHTVITGVALLDRANGTLISDKACTRVRFKPLSDREIEAYIKTGEPMGKAGAYAIQGKCSLLIQEIKGDYFNVVGLPLQLIYDMFCQVGVNLLSGGN